MRGDHVDPGQKLHNSGNHEQHWTETNSTDGQRNRTCRARLGHNSCRVTWDFNGSYIGDDDASMPATSETNVTINAEYNNTIWFETHITNNNPAIDQNITIIFDFNFHARHRLLVANILKCTAILTKYFNKYQFSYCKLILFVTASSTLQAIKYMQCH